MRDYYEILNLDRHADADAIKKAYRKLALEYHPDRNSGSAEAEERFKEATEAYEVLRDPQKRAAYDRFGHAGVRSGAGGRGPGFGGFDFADALNIFMRDFGGFGIEDLFSGGRARARQRTRKGPDMRVRVPLTLKEVAQGAHKTIKAKVLEPCEECAGTGGRGGAAPERCEMCGGAGEVRRVQRSMLGQLVSVAPCPRCEGRGDIVRDPCAPCGGRGLAPQQKQFEVDVPPGVSTGDYITLAGQGNAAERSGARGDVIVVLEVVEDPRFTRDGADLVLDMPITFTQAALGAEVEVPTVDGVTKLRVPAGSQSGRLLRMRGRGLPHLRGSGRGDQIVRLRVWVPTELSPEQEEAIRRLARVESPAPERADGDTDRGFWNRVKEAFSA
ncbi:MAG: molecular chaperone DnaJ [Longimicrobiales bacterium]